MCLTLFRFSIKHHQVFVNFTYDVRNQYANYETWYNFIHTKECIDCSRLIQEIQTITTTAPATIPLIAPARVKSFQYKESRVLKD